MTNFQHGGQCPGKSRSVTTPAPTPAPGQGSPCALSPGSRAGLPTCPLLFWKERLHPGSDAHLLVVPTSIDALNVHSGPQISCEGPAPPQLSGTVVWGC